MSILLVTPPFTQLNTPYPATAYLKGFLNTKGIATEQMDLGIEVILELFTAHRLEEIFKRARPRVRGTLKGGVGETAPSELSDNARRILALSGEYLATVEPVVAFLQGRQPTLARQIASENFLPQAGRFAQLIELDLAFGSMGLQDKAKHLATLYLEDLSDFIVETLDPHFGFSRYAERLGRSANSFDELSAALQQPLSYIDELTVQLLDKKLASARRPRRDEGADPSAERRRVEDSMNRLTHSADESGRCASAEGRRTGNSSRLTHSADESGRCASASADELAPSANELSGEVTMLCLSVPFPGNLFSALRCAQYVRAKYPEITVTMGGGFPNTELRSVSDVRVFEFVHYITLDDGERPLELLWNHLAAKTSLAPVRQAQGPPAAAPAKHPPLKRTFHLEDGAVLYNNFSLERDYRMSEVGTPDYTGLPLDRYVSVIEIANPMHSLWSDGRWNKLTMAHGCYWGKCTFCDVSLDYIGNYQPVAASLLVDRMEELIAQTGESGFHFVDEAAPPALMRDVALEIIRRNLRVTWWTNIRFEKNFTANLCRLLQASGCIAVSGGLEVASDRLLDLIKKGVTVEQVARVTGAFTDAGIMVHSYLMYGYPTQTVQETVDSLEMVRQLFEAGVIQSGFWHRFALTSHSPVGLDPDAYGIIPHRQKITFADNDVAFTDPTGVEHERFSYGLKKSLFNYMHGLCFDYPLQEWFDFRIPATTIDPDYIAEALDHVPDLLARDNARVIWIGGDPSGRPAENGTEIILYDRRDTDYFVLPNDLADWLLTTLHAAGDRSEKPPTIGQLKSSFQETFGESLAAFWETEAMEMVRAYGLLVV